MSRNTCIGQELRKEISAFGAVAMNAGKDKPWPRADLAELKFGLAAGSTIEEIAEFLHRDIEDVRQMAACQKRRPADDLQRS
jgi:hypothetical protein